MCIRDRLDIMENNLCLHYKGRHIIQNAGHWVQQENHVDVAKTLIDFFKNNNLF